MASSSYLVFDPAATDTLVLVPQDVGQSETWLVLDEFGLPPIEILHWTVPVSLPQWTVQDNLPEWTAPVSVPQWTILASLPQWTTPIGRPEWTTQDQEQ